MNRDERCELALEHLSCLPQHERLEIALRIFSQAPAYGHGEVDNTPFREHYLIQHIREGLTADEVARRMEWFLRHKRPSRLVGARNEAAAFAVLVARWHANVAETLCPNAREYILANLDQVLSTTEGDDDG